METTTKKGCRGCANLRNYDGDLYCRRGEKIEQVSKVFMDMPCSFHVDEDKERTSANMWVKLGWMHGQDRVDDAMREADSGALIEILESRGYKVVKER